jgi:hypothetical protein
VGIAIRGRRHTGFEERPISSVEAGIGGQTAIFHAVTQFGDDGLPPTQLLLERGSEGEIPGRLLRNAPGATLCGTDAIAAALLLRCSRWDFSEVFRRQVYDCRPAASNRQQHGGSALSTRLE